jgi:protein SCO1
MVGLSRTVLAYSIAIACAMQPAVLCAQSEGAHHVHQAQGNPGDRPAGITGVRVPDVELVNQDGKRVRFYSDLVTGKIVAINTIFTTCTTICPLMGANFAKLSKLLSGEGAGKLSLISISIDPAEDTPERLKQWARGFGETGSEWTLLTGAKSEIDGLLKALQIFTADKQDHAPLVLIGGEGASDWVRASALLPPARLADLIRARLAPAADHSIAR